MFAVHVREGFMDGLSELEVSTVKVLDDRIVHYFHRMSGGGFGTGNGTGECNAEVVKEVVEEVDDVVKDVEKFAGETCNVGGDDDDNDGKEGCIRGDCIAASTDGEDTDDDIGGEGKTVRAEEVIEKTIAAPEVRL